MSTDNSDDSPCTYAIRLTEPAEAEIEAAYLHLMGATSLEFADRWQDGLIDAINGLTLFPTGYAVAPESVRFQIPVRRMVYRLGRVVYRILFTLLDADGDGQEDTVRILHVRHGAQLAPGEAAEHEE